MQRCARIVLVLVSLVVLGRLGGAGPALAAETVDRIHGIAYPERPGWVLRVGPEGFVWTDRRRFVHWRTLPPAARDPQAAIMAWARERGVVDPRAGVVWRRFGDILALRARGMPFPAMLANYVDLRQLHAAYDEIALIEPTPEAVVVLSILAPEGSSPEAIDELIAFARAIRALPQHERIPARKETFFDLETGQPAGWVHIPQDAVLRGGILPQGSKRVPVLEIRSPNVLVRLDAVDVNVSVVQSPFGAQGQVLLIVNGQSALWPGFVRLASASDFAAFLCSLWEMETGTRWQLERLAEVPPPDVGARALIQPSGSHSLRLSFELLAHGGTMQRRAFVDGFSVAGGDASPWAASSQLSANLSVFLYEAAPRAWDIATGIAQGIVNSLQLDAQAARAAAERWHAEQKQINRWVQDWLAQRREERSRNATAWSNLLSDQTYVRDPATGEVSRIAKPSWAEGSFWREPIFADSIIGPLREGSALETLLREEGWRRLEESLEGFR